VFILKLHITSGEREIAMKRVQAMVEAFHTFDLREDLRMSGKVSWPIKTPNIEAAKGL